MSICKEDFVLDPYSTSERVYMGPKEGDVSPRPVSSLPTPLHIRVLRAVRVRAIGNASFTVDCKSIPFYWR
ncbi:hypothetical protein CR513_60667, partial [Mucuna pruriens]